MIEQILSTLANFAITIISTLGYGGIFFLMLLQSAAVPIPSEVTMPFSGFLISEGRFMFVWVVIAGVTGNLIGALITYYLGRYGGRPLIERYGKYVLISERDLEITDRFFKRFGALAVFFGRMLPIVSTFISIPAGIAKVKLSKFIIYTFFGALIWNIFLTTIGFQLGENWESLKGIFQKLDWVIFLIIIAGGVWWVYRHIINSKRKIQ